MKFGITPISFDILDASFDLKNLKFPLLVERAIDAGYQHIEISMDMEYVLPGSISKRVIKKLLQIKKEYDVTYSVHLPIWAIELASPNTLIRNASINCCIESITRTRFLEPLAYVIHLTGALAAEFSRANLDPKLKRSIAIIISGFAAISVEKILSLTKIVPRLLAVENVEFPFDATRQIVDKYDLSICFDTGHQLVGFSGPDTVQEFLAKHQTKIIAYHLNGGKIMPDGRANDHIALCDCQFPMDTIGTILKTGFAGPVVFELGLQDAQKSLECIQRSYPSVKP